MQRTQRSTVFEIFLSLFARYPHNPLRSLRLRAFALDFYDSGSVSIYLKTG